MRALGRFTRMAAPIAFLVGPVLYTLDTPSPGLSIVGGVCMGIGLSASYVLLERIAEAYCTKRNP